MVVNEDVKKTLDALNKKSGLPLGFLFAWPFPTPPDGAIQCNGAQYNRTLYADFYAYISSKGWVKTESEWQSTATANGGYCPWYSDGDGSTTFRTPKFAPFMQIAIVSGSVGTYHSAGLPNIEGEVLLERPLLVSNGATGAFSLKYQGNYRYSFEGSYGTSNNNKFNLNASDFNGIYGASDTVQPESHEWMICVVVAGQATNIGSVDVGNVISAVSQVQAELPNKLNNTTPHIVNTWKNEDGSSWYRKWSDGLIEQGVTYVGSPTKDCHIRVTLPISFSTASYNVLAQAFKLDKDYIDRAVTTDVFGKTTSSVYCGWFISQSADVTSIYVYAQGY